MKQIYFIALLVLASAVVFGCTQTTSNSVADQVVMEKKSIEEHPDGMMSEEGFEMINGKMIMVNEKTKTQAPMEKDTTLNDGTKVMTNGKVMRKDGTSFVLKGGESIWMDGSFMEAGEMMEEESNQRILAGTKSKYYRFDKSHYEKSLAEGKVIFLDFHANWCPICKQEQPNIFEAFNELSNENVVGYQVHYNDDETNDDDKEMAKKFGVTYQHTKVIINKNGEVALKSLEAFSKERVIDEINKVVK